ncbi:centrosomal protein of 70 kDa-like isoform X2 [Ptychodera flava]|uniref:centrosomal protein of 70 kDa-like isoform X2 n=1 Tax=Ptychodera flava TaxID=63121 RepID=UPI003969EBC3
MASSSETSPQKADDEMPIPADSLDDDNIETARSTEIGIQADILINQMTQFDTEEWKEANKLLRQHGLPTVEMCHPSQITDIGDVVVLESSMARIVRENLISLVHDSDRRQEIIQDLIVSNNQIKNDIDKCQSNARRIEEEKRDLEILLDNAKDKMQEIEDAHLARLRQHDNTTEMLRLSRETTDRRCRHLEEKCSKQEDEINRLKKKLRMLVESEEARIERQTEVFQKYRHRSSRPHSTSDQRLLDIIDAYEGQIAKLKDDLRFYRREAEICRDASIGKRTERLDGKALLSDDSLSSDNRGLSLAGNAGRWNLDLDPSPNYKALVKSYQGQLSESRATVKDLENQVETLKLEMEARPQLKDLRKLQHKIKKLERLLAANNISVNEDSNKKTSHGSHIQDIKHMPINVCRQYLKEICVELNVSDVDDIVYQLRQPSKETEALLHLEKILREVLAIVDDPDAPKLPLTPKRVGKRHAVWCDKSTHHIVPTLQYWLQQMIEIQYLKSSLNGLATSLVPWSPPVFPASSLDKPTSVSEIRAAVDSLAVQTARVEKTKSSKEAPMHQLQSVVSHFQNLFDVPTLEGVYPRMNEIYTKLGETHNVLHTLRELLGLEENAKSTAIVNAVGEICSIHNSTTTQQLKQLLQVEDLESAIGRLQQYEDFFPAFQGVIDQLMEVLGIDRMERIVPAVRTLKLLAG